MKKERISSTQLAMLLFMIVTSTLLQFVPTVTTSLAGESAWVIPFTMPLGISLFMFWVYIKLHDRFPGLDFFQLCQTLTGIWGARAIGLAYGIFFIITDIIIVRQFADFVNLAMLQQTPPWVIILSLGFVGVYGAYMGIEVISRANQFILPLLTLSFVITTSLSLQNTVSARLFPLIKEGIMPILRGSIALTAWYGEIVIYLVLLPLLNNYKDYKRKTGIALLMVAVFLTIDIAFSIMVFSAPLVSKFPYPFWSLIRSVEYQDYVQRIESVIFAFWMTGVVIKVAVFCYLIAWITAKTFNLKSYRSALLPTGVIKFGGAIVLFQGAFKLQALIFNFWVYFAFLFELFIPLGLLVFAVIRKKRQKGAVR